MKRIQMKCSVCSAVIEVLGERYEVESVLTSDTEFPCQETDGCAGVLQRVLRLDEECKKLITVGDLWRSTLGPDKELSVSPRDVFECVGKTIAEVTVKEECGRCLLEKVRFSDGTQLWLAASGLGPVVYRMRREP